MTLVFGALLYRPVARRFGDLHGDLGTDPDPAPTERSLYHDAAFLRGRTVARGEGDPGAASVDEIAALFEQCWRRSIVRTHTISPDSPNLDRWIRSFADWRDRMDEARTRLATAYRDPDPDLLERYVEDPTVHDPGDPLLELVRAHHRGEADPSALAPALDAADGSVYARAVRDGVRNVRVAGAYLEGEIDRATLVERLGARRSATGGDAE
jgi:hypothetical protein